MDRDPAETHGPGEDDQEGLPGSYNRAVRLRGVSGAADRRADECHEARAGGEATPENRTTREASRPPQESATAPATARVPCTPSSPETRTGSGCSSSRSGCTFRPTPG